MVVYDAGAGEIRRTMQDFFDPASATATAGAFGTKVVMEVRARKCRSSCMTGKFSFKVLFERLADRPGRLYGVGLGSSYQNQTL